MMLKLQAPIPGEQPNQGVGGIAVMTIQPGPRVGVLYVEGTVIKAAGGGGVTSLPVLTDIFHPTNPLMVKIGGNQQIIRLASELIALNKLQDASAAGSVQYFQAGVLIATVNDASNASATGLGLATNTATTAIFQLPIYFAEYWRKSLATAEALAWPTRFTDGSVLKDLSIEVPIANNGGGALSGHGIKYWMDYDEIAWPSAPVIVKKNRYTKQYSVAGDISLAFTQKDLLLQFSVLLATGDTFTKIVIKKNGKVLREVTKARNDQTLLDHGLNAASGLVPNRLDIVFDVNDDPNSGVPLQKADTFEITATLASVAGAAQMVILTESYGSPD